jgi:hypothetical protein
MYQQQKKTPFCALTMYLRSTGNQSPKYEYKADAKSLFTCSLTKKKYKLSQIDEWYHTEGVQNFVIMIKPFKPQPSVDGMKPIAESMPRYKEMPMTEARPSAPDHAKTAGMSDFDDDLPPF